MTDARITGEPDNLVTRASDAALSAAWKVLQEADAIDDDTRVIAIISAAAIDDSEDSTTGAKAAVEIDGADVLADLFYHLQKVFEANGKTMAIAPLEQLRPKGRHE